MTHLPVVLEDHLGSQITIGSLVFWNKEKATNGHANSDSIEYAIVQSIKEGTGNRRGKITVSCLPIPKWVPGGYKHPMTGVQNHACLTVLDPARLPEAKQKILAECQLVDPRYNIIH